MSNRYLEIDLLGDVFVEEIFLYYEEPLLFSCKNLFGHIFLVNCIDLDEDNKSWLFLPITPIKLEHVKKNRISLHDAFIEPEANFLWLVKKSNSRASAVRINPQDLSTDDLPTKEAYIDIEDEIVPEYKIDERNLLAQKENRVVFDVSLQQNEGHSTEITPEVLAKTITEIQNVVYSIAHKTGSINSNFPPSIIGENQLNITSTYAASFGIRFMSKQLCNVFGDAKVSKQIEVLMDLMSVKNDSVRIKEILSSLSPKVGIHYKKILSVLINNRTAVKMYYTSPKSETKELSLSLSELKSSLKTLESEIDNSTRILKYMGTLVGVDVVNKTFSFIPHDEKKITGKISVNLNADIFTVPLSTNLSLEEKFSINKLTQKEQIEYTLLNIFE